MPALLPFIAAGASVIGAGAAVAGAIGSGNAQQAAAQQQQQEAQQQLQFEQQSRSQAQSYAETYGSIQPGEIQQLQTMINNQTASYNKGMAAIAQQKKMLAQAQPAIASAGQNLTNLMNGQSAAILGPLQQQLQLQRNQLTQSLASQYGSGWASTTNGIDAMMKFDNQSALITAQAQQSAISNVSQSMSSLMASAPNIAQSTNQLFQTLGNQGSQIAGAENAINSRTVGSLVSATNATPVNFNPSIGLAGANQVGSMSIFNSLGTMGSKFGSMFAPGSNIASAFGSPSPSGGSPNSPSGPLDFGADSPSLGEQSQTIGQNSVGANFGYGGGMLTGAPATPNTLALSGMGAAFNS
jgi:hypothetical protein